MREREQINARSSAPGRAPGRTQEETGTKYLTGFGQTARARAGAAFFPMLQLGKFTTTWELLHARERTRRFPRLAVATKRCSSVEAHPARQGEHRQAERAKGDIQGTYG
jgi:hypothetical protein